MENSGVRGDVGKIPDANVNIGKRVAGTRQVIGAKPCADTITTSPLLCTDSCILQSCNQTGLLSVVFHDGTSTLMNVLQVRYLSGVF